MIVRSLHDLEVNGNTAENPGVWHSARYLLRSDEVGFSLHATSISAGAKFTMEYKNHTEANLIIEGSGTVTDVASGEVYELGPGVMYTLDKHDRHVLEAATDMRIVCVFTPALLGPETHDEDGSYPIL